MKPGIVGKVARRGSLTRGLLLFVVLVLVPVMEGCAGNVKKSWAEEVALDDGTVIVVDRFVEYQTSESWAGDIHGTKEIASRLSFRGELSKLPPWNMLLVPLLLYRDSPSGEWVVVASAFSCEAARERGNPRNLYWEFRLRERVWEGVALQASSFGRKTNLYFMYEAPLSNRFLTLAAKEEIVASRRVGKKFLFIDEKYRSNCN